MNYFSIVFRPVFISKNVSTIQILTLQKISSNLSFLKFPKYGGNEGIFLFTIDNPNVGKKSFMRRHDHQLPFFRTIILLFHLSFDCSILRKKNAAIFTEFHGKCVPDKGSDMRISRYEVDFSLTYSPTR